MSENKRVFAIDSASIPAMQKLSSSASIESATIPAMTPVPTTQSNPTESPSTSKKQN